MQATKENTTSFRFFRREKNGRAWRIFIDKDWLFKQYITLRRPAIDIANEVGCSRRVIWQRTKDFGFKRPSLMPPMSESTKQKLSTINSGKSLSNKTKRRISKSMSGQKHYNWKGGDIVRFETFAPHFKGIEKIRRNANDSRLLEVTCIYCGRWFIPEINSVFKRVAVINGKRDGDARLYCSVECKKNCAIYWQTHYPKKPKKATSREVQPELRQMVFKRDHWQCQRCEKTRNLHCHHITGVKQNPVESADVDNCITLCIICHQFIHTLEGCTYRELACTQ